MLAAHCGSDSNDNGGTTNSWTLTPRTTLEGFSVTPLQIRPTERGFLGAFLTQDAAGEPVERHVRLVGVDGNVAYDHAYPFDLVSGRLSETAGGSVFLSEAAEVIDDASFRVRIRKMSLADGALQDYALFREPIFDLPENALHLGKDGQLWCLGINTDLVLTLFGLGPNGPTTQIPIATMKALDLGSQIIGLRDGFAVVTEADGVDARFGVPSSSASAEQITVLTFDHAGNFIEAKTTAFGARTALGAVRVDDTRMVITGSLKHALNDHSLFLQSWTIGPDARLTPEAERTFDVGNDQVQVSALDVAPDGRWIAGGEEGLRQAETHSVLQGSRAFVATLSAPPAFALEGIATFGTPQSH
ncbi:hypothetical protein LVJ94_11775 [Pendulispora rubella]|uniref:Phytase-like domain-containing protein n=1 Tax=Pendulispora rubella TaxID=2741070 RepID=A0ABZ2LAG1_9BACT